MDPQFLEAVKAGDVGQVTAMLEESPALAGYNFSPESQHTDGYPLYHAAHLGNMELVELLLNKGADVNASLPFDHPDFDDPREFGMPLMNALENKHYAVVHKLLDNGANLNAFPYCSTPFVDCLCNATWQHPEFAAQVAEMIAVSFNNYFNVRVADSPLPELPGDAPQPVALLRRSVSKNGQPSLFTVVRHQQHDLLRRLLAECPDAPGPKSDWPNGRVVDNICNGASWCGYPETLDLVRKTCPEFYNVDSAKNSIRRAILSHNRDGNIDDYVLLIESELKFLKENQFDLSFYQKEDPFVPLHWLVVDFIEPRNYGFKCETLSTTADQLRLADVFIRFGCDPTIPNPETEATPIQLAESKGQIEYAEFLTNSGQS